MTSRSHLIEEACNIYIHLKQCPVCGAMNPENGLNCAVCGNELSLSIYEYDLRALKIMSIKDPDRFKAIMKKINPEYTEWLDIREKEREEIRKNDIYEGA